MVDCCDKLDELLDGFRRFSPWPATNETSSGEDGWEARLGDEPVWPTPDGEGEAGRCDALAFESVRCTGIDVVGLPSTAGAGEVALFMPPGLAPDLLCAAAAA